MKKIAKQFLPLIFLLLLILFPTISIKGAKTGLMLWYSTVVPTLLPFIIISNLIVRTGGMQYFTYLFYPIYLVFHKLLKCLPYVCVIGFFCGYPMGAKIINDLTVQNQMTRKQGQFLLNTCNNASPMFIIGYVVVATLKSSVSILEFMGFVYLPVLLYGALYLLLHPRLLKEPEGVKHGGLSFSGGSLDDTIMDAFVIVMRIGGYIMLFSIAAQLFIHMNIQSQLIRLLLIGFSEVTTGVSYISQSLLSGTQKIALIAAATTFGGLSSIAQTKSVLTSSKLSILPYLLTKLLLALMSYLFVTVYYAVLGS